MSQRDLFHGRMENERGIYFSCDVVSNLAHDRQLFCGCVISPAWCFALYSYFDNFSLFFSSSRIFHFLKVKLHYNVKVTFFAPKSFAIYALMWMCVCMNNYT